ncbi:MAG: hypothetical protein ACREQQ_04015, partial [Candidatus Binatia bacterium]
AELYTKTVGQLETIPLEPVEIRPVSEAVDRTVPPDARQRIREIAAAGGSWFPPGWRPIALYPFAARTDLLLYLGCGVALWLAATLPRPDGLLRMAVASTSAIALLAIVELMTRNGHVLWFFDSYESGPIGPHPRMLGPFVNPDHLATFLELGLAPGAALLVTISRGGGGRRFVWRRRPRFDRAL